MTIAGWVAFILSVLTFLIVGIGIAIVVDTSSAWVATTLVVAMLSFGCWFGFHWYFENTASGQRALVDQRSELNNGLERTVTVYTANGDVIATFTGKLDIEANDGGYIKFDFQGKRYMYYNCFVETIADIE